MVIRIRNNLLLKLNRILNGYIILFGIIGVGIKASSYHFSEYAKFNNTIIYMHFEFKTSPLKPSFNNTIDIWLAFQKQMSN
jgi:hypothetical protein